MLEEDIISRRSPSGVVALSKAQHSASSSGAIPEPELVRDDLWSVAQPMPGEVVGYTLSAVFAPRGGPATIIDPGWGSPLSLVRLEEFMTSIGRSLADVGTVILTHAHPDHSGLAVAIRERTGAAIALHGDEQRSIDAETVTPVISRERLREWGLDRARVEELLHTHAEASRQTPLRSDRQLRDGDEVIAGDRRLRVLHSPGHTPGHICLSSSQDGILFSGDLVLPTVNPGMGLGGTTDRNPLSAYLTSLAETAEFDEHEVVPGHGYRFRGLAPRRAQAISYMLHRAVEVRDVITQFPGADVVGIASRLTWRAGWSRLEQSVMLAPALRQVAHYRDFVLLGGLEEFGHLRAAR